MTSKKVETKPGAVLTSAKAMVIAPINRRWQEFCVVGDTPLIVHAWSAEAREEMLRKQMGYPTRKKQPKNPQAQIDASFYFTQGGEYGIHTIGFKKAMVGACRFVDAKMTEARGAFFVFGDRRNARVAKIYGANPEPREDMVRVGMGTADIRFRPQFPEWGVKLFVEYDASAIGPDHIANLLNRAGFSPGVGEWRPERDGDFGRFHVADAKEWAEYERRTPRVGSIQMPEFFPVVPEGTSAPGGDAE